MSFERIEGIGMKICILWACLIVVMPAIVTAREMVLSPVAEVLIYNPEDSSDVRLLLRFDLSQGVTGQDLISASLRLFGVIPESCLLKIGLLSTDWGQTTDWRTVSNRLSDDPGFGSEAKGCEFAAQLEPDPTAERSAAVEFPMTDLVRVWLAGPTTLAFGIRAVESGGRESCGPWHDQASATLIVLTQSQTQED